VGDVEAGQNCDLRAVAGEVGRGGGQMTRAERTQFGFAAQQATTGRVSTDQGIKLWK